MPPKSIIILRNTLSSPAPSADTMVVNFDGLKNWVFTGKIFKNFLRYRQAKLLTYRLEVLPQPFITALLLRLISRGTCCFEDELGRRRVVTPGLIFNYCCYFIKDFFFKFMLIRLISRETENLIAQYAPGSSGRGILNLSASPVYLRTDMWFGVCSGGSVGHIAGVLNHLHEFTGKPVFLSTDYIPTVNQDIETHIILPRSSGWDFSLLPGLFFNETFCPQAIHLLNGKRPSFIYQRYSLYNYAGIKLAKYYHVPLVLEYNGSEIWVNRHWGKPLKYEALAERIELLNLQYATVVVVVSQPLKDELVARGIEAGKILVNPNGVDPQRYSPGIDGAPVRRKYHLEGRTVIGFTGTFGRWHGAEVLAESFGLLLREFPEYRGRVRLLMIGDGLTMPRVQSVVRQYGIMDDCTFTGLIPQAEGPAHLAACDILVSPHVPNPDGSPFFGSPTKLFEYMAMGKGIVASDLEQIGEVLRHGHTAWLVKPGDAASLMLGLKTLLDDKNLRHRLGRNSRDEVVARYTWREHTGRIIDRLTCTVVI